uniref:Uncharacterized protein n=1 Tax=Oryza barthii TaxID=65489 RepID=A0A0D3HW93_9ORYZ
MAGKRVSAADREGAAERRSIGRLPTRRTRGGARTGGARVEEQIGHALVYLILRSLSSVFSKDSKLGGDVAAETREKGMWLDRTEVASVDNDEACELVSGADLVIGVDVDDEGEDMSAPHLPAAASRHHRQRQRLDGGVVESILKNPNPI